MIGKLSGRLDWRGMDQVLIDVRGVGYIVHVNDRTLAAMPAIVDPFDYIATMPDQDHNGTASNHVV